MLPIKWVVFVSFVYIVAAFMGGILSGVFPPPGLSTLDIFFIHTTITSPSILMLLSIQKMATFDFWWINPIVRWIIFVPITIGVTYNLWVMAIKYGFQIWLQRRLT